MPTLTIFAGVNGAGKTSFYNIINKKHSSNLGIRINTDEILNCFNGDWKCIRDNLKAAKYTIELIEDSLNNNQSFNWELTLFTPFHLKYIEIAKEKGYDINLYYISVNNLQTALDRVDMRVKTGGHGVDENLIKSRYANQFKFLPQALTYINKAYFYDNTFSINLVAIYKHNKFIIKNDTYAWVNNLKLINLENNNY